MYLQSKKKGVKHMRPFKKEYKKNCAQLNKIKKMESTEPMVTDNGLVMWGKFNSNANKNKKKESEKKDEQ